MKLEPENQAVLYQIYSIIFSKRAQPMHVVDFSLNRVIALSPSQLFTSKSPYTVPC